MGDTFERQLSGLSSFSFLRQLGTKLKAIFISRRWVTRLRFADVTSEQVVFCKFQVHVSGTITTITI